jgi:soluble lytic murein transglycosylase-like protein
VTKHMQGKPATTRRIVVSDQTPDDQLNDPDR